MTEQQETLKSAIQTACANLIDNFEMALRSDDVSSIIRNLICGPETSKNYKLFIRNFVLTYNYPISSLITDIHEFWNPSAVHWGGAEGIEYELSDTDEDELVSPYIIAVYLYTIKYCGVTLSGDLKTLLHDSYLDQIHNWEEKHGYDFSDNAFQIAASNLAEEVLRIMNVFGTILKA